MLKSYFDLSSNDQKLILQKAETELGKKDSVLEKDIWVCWGLRALFSIPNAHPMVFKGGTSLSKGYNLIDRFSEDIDITLDYKSFVDDGYNKYPEKYDPFADGASKTQTKKYSERLKSYVREYATNTIVPNLQKEIDKLPKPDQYCIEIDESGENIRVYYPSVIKRNEGYSPDNVLIELGGRNVITPNEVLKIAPYVAELSDLVSYPSCDISVFSPERTFWEKATLIHVECNREIFKKNAERLSRHWYDLVMLSHNPTGQSAIKNHALLEEVIRLKKVFYYASSANYDNCISGKIKLAPSDNLLEALRLDYEKMIEAGMIYGAPLAFNQIIEEIRELENVINVG